MFKPEVLYRLKSLGNNHATMVGRVVSASMRATEYDVHEKDNKSIRRG